MMDLITGLLGGGGGLYAIIGGIVAAVGAALGLYIKGRTDGAAKARLKSAETTVAELRADKALDTKIEKETDDEILARISKP